MARPLVRTRAEKRARREEAEAAAKAKAEAAAKAKAHLPNRRCPLHSNSEEAPITGSRSSARRQNAIKDTRSSTTQAYNTMLSNGWCCLQVDHLRQTYDATTFSLLANLERSAVRTVDHSHCSARNDCSAYNADLRNYKTRHTTAECECDLIVTPHEDLARVLRSNQIPLLSFHESSHDAQGLLLRVRSRTEASKYIAISHVWADGLGNPTRNGLPTCQMRQLHKSLKALWSLLGYENAQCLFWMDTLCIPVGPDSLALKLAQIDRMASIYVGAESSLVLDSELMQTSVSPLQGQQIRRFPLLRQEAYARLACSVWMTRSWTLQEGYLPPLVSVQFLDELVILGRKAALDGTYCERAFTSGVTERIHPRNLIRVHDIAQQSVLEANITLGGRRHAQECVCFEIEVEKVFFHTMFLEDKSFAAAWNDLGGRSTSMSMDVPIIIANILGLENRLLLQYQETSQMLQAIILSLDRVPLSLFFNDGSKLDGNHNNRWVPEGISHFQLTETESLSVHESHFSYEYSPHPSDLDDSQHTTMYIFHGALQLRPSGTIDLYCEQEGSTFTIELCEPASAGHSGLNTSDFDTTYIVIDRISSAGRRSRTTHGDDRLQGASFFAKSTTLEESEAWDELRTKQPRGGDPNPLETTCYQTPVTFGDALRIRKNRNTDPRGLISGHAFKILRVQNPFRLNIKHDPPPCFRRLRRLSMPDYSELLYVCATGSGVIATCGFLWLVVYIGEDYLTKNALGWLFFSSWAFSVFLWVMLIPIVTHYSDSMAERLSRRWRLKFYEAIARERQAASSV